MNARLSEREIVDIGLETFSVDWTFDDMKRVAQAQYEKDEAWFVEQARVLVEAAKEIFGEGSDRTLCCGCRCPRLAEALDSPLAKMVLATPAEKEKKDA